MQKLNFDFSEFAEKKQHEPRENKFTVRKTDFQIGCVHVQNLSWRLEANVALLGNVHVKNTTVVILLHYNAIIMSIDYICTVSVKTAVEGVVSKIRQKILFNFSLLNCM